jgi:hypothetical protein
MKNKESDLDFLTKLKKGVVTEYLPWLLIALAVLVIVVISIFFLKGKGTSMIDSLRNLFRSG